MREAVAKAEALYETGENLPPVEAPRTEDFPFRVTKRIKPGEDYGELRGEIVVGRALWLWGIQHVLTTTAKVLHEHKWTILAPPRGLTWFTSDNPVIRLNFHGLLEYDFQGGWGSANTDIIFPLSPNHLFYTQVGHRPPPRGTEMPWPQAMMIRRFIAEHADRMIFASNPDDQVPKLRPRIVSDDQVKHEKAQWEQWHENQTRAERGISR